MAQLDADTLQEWRERYSNRGRWGSGDVHGTLNFVTRERVLAACAIPRSGLVVSCALAPELEAPRRGEALPASGSESALEMGRSTRWRPPGSGAVPAAPYTGRGLLDRRRVGEPRLDGSTRGVIGRGILLDFPRYARRPWLDDGARIRASDLDACAEAFGVTPEPGDIVLVRTGMLRRCLQQRSFDGYDTGPAPGLSVHCARWIYEREIALLASDTWRVEARPSEAHGCIDPLTTICLADTRLVLGEIFDLEELAESCAEDGRYAFLFSAAPLPVTSGGGPVAPLAIK